ncbi:hypothetical protein M8C21_003154, partial [Ambrosia artemisiifolia]
IQLLTFDVRRVYCSTYWLSSLHLGGGCHLIGELWRLAKASFLATSLATYIPFLLLRCFTPLISGTLVILRFPNRLRAFEYAAYDVRVYDVEVGRLGTSAVQPIYIPLCSSAS